MNKVVDDFSLEFEEGHEGNFLRLKKTLRNLQLMDLPQNHMRKSAPKIAGTTIKIEKQANGDKW